MNKLISIGLITLLLTMLSLDVAAQDKAKKNEKPAEAKELSGISIVGNEEAPKSLFIVPWKTSEIGIETGLTSKLLDEKMSVVDKDVFDRELDYFYATNAK